MCFVCRMTGFSDWNSGVFCLLTDENRCAFAFPRQSGLSDDKRRCTRKKRLRLHRKMLHRQYGMEHITVRGAIANYLRLSLSSLKFQTIFGSDLFQGCMRNAYWNLTMGCVRVRVVAAEKQKYYILLACVCGLSHPAWKAHVPYYIAISCLSGCTTLFHIIS
jgi:hypothetical protein